MAIIQDNLGQNTLGVDSSGSASVKVMNSPTVSFNNNDFSKDSFERLRVSQPVVVFEDSFAALLPSAKTTIWEAVATASGTANLTSNLYGTELNTLLTNGSGYWIQSYNHVRYAPGISVLFRITFNFNQLTTSVRQRVGMFTDQGTYPSNAGDGFYLEAAGSSISVVRRYMTTGVAGAEERVAQANWNMDKLDGTGASGVALDWTKTQHFVVEYQWLGVGTIRFGFETGQNQVVWCHQIISVNALSQSWSRTGTLPVRAEIYSTGVLATAGKLTLINCVVIHEGDVGDLRGWKYFGGNSGATPKVGGLVAATWYPVMGIRAAGTNDLTKRARILPTSVTFAVASVATGATVLQVGLMMLATPNTGATYAVTTGGSAAVIDTAATAATAVTGTLIWSGLIPNVIGAYTFDLSTLNDNMNVIGTVASGAQAITGAGNLTVVAGCVQTATVGAGIVASLNWKELV